jgi:hypothetical protein
MVKLQLNMSRYPADLPFDSSISEREEFSASNNVMIA